KLIATASDDAVRIWETLSGQPVGMPLEHGAEKIAWSLDGRRLMAAGIGDVRIWDATGEPIGPPLLFDDIAIHATWSLDRLRLAIASGDGTARIWNMTTGKPIGGPLPHKDIEVVGWSPDGTLLATGAVDGSGKIWEISTGKQIGPSLQHQRRIIAVA